MPSPEGQELHKRARESGNEARKLTTALSAGGVASMFIALTTKIEPALSRTQRWLAGVAVVAFGLAVLSGMLAWHADAERWFFWAKEVEETDPASKVNLKRQGKHWARKTWQFSKGLRYGFFTGVSAAVFYTLARVIYR